MRRRRAARSLARSPEYAEIPGLLERLGIPGIVDAHVHLFPAGLQERIWAHFERLRPPWPLPHRLHGEALLAFLAAAGVRHHTALAYAHRPGLAEELNAHTLGLAERWAQVIPTFTVHPEPGVEDIVARALERGGRCAKAHPQVGCFRLDDPVLAPVWRLLQERGVPVVAHAGAVDDGSRGAAFCRFDAAEALVRRFPGLTVVVAHAGAPEFESYLGLLDDAPNVWMDLSGVFPAHPRLGAFPAELVPRLRGHADRLVWGSDLPVAATPFEEQLAGLVGAGFSDPELAGLLWHNAVRLFSLPHDGSGGTRRRGRRRARGPGDGRRAPAPRG